MYSFYYRQLFETILTSVVALFRNLAIGAPNDREWHQIT
jgi:hypothetical protein